ncbi:hypothetical protein MESS2_1710008 [Mesorhizobium metallidurans STM 2683]|uniref:Uncharacterized protein n=1 Tax=Mesorhizobium metallidurans STM 2683 TaxID=1297569 RepID=M5F290_9HYPH|nr:hypothetical protein MESS2_1710008 [Mesorhizobium metallidurans STM 2683]
MNDGSTAAEVGLATTPMCPLERSLLARSADFKNAIKGTVQANAYRGLDNYQVGQAAPIPFPDVRFYRWRCPDSQAQPARSLTASITSFVSAH